MIGRFFPLRHGPVPESAACLRTIGDCTAVKPAGLSAPLTEPRNAAGGNRRENPSAKNKKPLLGAVGDRQLSGAAASVRMARRTASFSGMLGIPP